MPEFAERLRTAFADKQKRERREGRRYTQGDLASGVGVALNTVQGWFNRGARPRDVATLTALARELGTTTDELLGGEEAGGGAGQPADDAPATMLPRVMQGLPYEIRVWLQAELLDYAKARVSERELHAARELLERPEVFTFYAGGAPQARTEDEVLLGMRSIAAVVRGELRRRGYKLDAESPY